MKTNYFYHIALMSSLLLHNSSYSNPLETYTEDRPLYTRVAETYEEKYRKQQLLAAQINAAKVQQDAMDNVNNTTSMIGRFIPDEKQNPDEFKKGKNDIASGYKRLAGAAKNIAGIGEQLSGYMEKQLLDWNRNLTPKEKRNKFKEYVFWGTLYATIPVVYYLMIKGAEITMDVIRAELLSPKPQILLPGSKYGRWDRISRWRSGYKSPAMIFDQQVKDRLIEIEEKTKNIRDHIRSGKKTTYDNLLLYGQPGTGKTLFAQILADKTNMDFLPVTAASLLQSGVEGIKYFDELITMANRSKYGVIIFVDEADALFVNRDTLSPESDHYKVLNHILALTGTGSNKFMLIAATNHAYVMDQAMGRRFQDRVLMPLPDAVTRKELLELYSKQVLFNIKENNQDFVKTAEKLLTPTAINTIVNQTNGLSHAEIKDMIVAMHKKACATKTGMITSAHIQRAVQEAIETST
jgi:ATPase family associated with various cellular activities (AAA)